jgi:2-haloacid dehalogenase
MSSSRRPTRVVFDLGNVLIHWDPRLVYDTIFPTTAEVDDFFSRVLPPEWNRAQDGGRTWREAEAVQIALFPTYANEIKAFRARWREMVPYPIGGTLRILERLKALKVPLYAITNFASDTFREAKTIYPFLNDSFIDTVVSGDEKLLKPGPEIFEVLLKRQKLDAADCVFIDDSRANVEAASRLGFQALHFTTPEAFAKDLRVLGFGV